MRKRAFVVIPIFILFLSKYTIFAQDYFTLRKYLINYLIELELKDINNEEKLIDIIDSIYVANNNSDNFHAIEYRYFRYDLVNEIYDTEKFKKGITAFFKGLYYYAMNLYLKSYEEFQKSIQIFKELGANTYVYDSYMLCSLQSFLTKDYKRTKELIDIAAMWLSKIENDTVRWDRTAVLNWNYGKMYLDMGNLEKAKFHLDSSRKLVEYLKNMKSVYQVEWNYYIVYLSLSKYFEQKNQLDSALAMYEEIKKLHKIVFNNLNMLTYQLLESIIKIYLKQNKYETAIETLKKYFNDLQDRDEQYKKLYLPRSILALYDEYAEAYYHIGNYKQSYQLQRELTDTYAQTLVEYKPLDAIAAKLDMELLLREEQLQQIMTNITFGVIFFIILISTLLYYYKYKKIRKLNQQLYELNDTKNRLFSIISHDLRGPILSANQLLESVTNKFDKLDDATKINLFTNIHHSMSKVVNLLENLLQWSQFQIKSNKINKDEIEIRHAIQKVIEQVDYLSRSKQIEINLDCISCDKIVMNHNEFEVLIRNLLTNSLKFSEDRGKIDIHVQKTNRTTTIEIVDYGIGMSDEARKLLLDSSKNYQRKGNKGENGSGLGLVIVKDILKRNNGKIEFLPNEPYGLKARIVLIN